MTDQIAGETDQASQEPEATEQVAEASATQETSDAAIWRKRQAGADAARAVAEKELADAKKRLAAYEAKEREADQAGMSETARLQAELEQAKQKAVEAERRAEAKVLDRLYPKARAEYPEVRDEAKLAKLEALLAEPEADTTPDVRSMRAPKVTAQAPAAEEAPKDILARLKTLPFN